MLRITTLCTILFAAATAWAQQSAPQLPQPTYHKKASDPEWLPYVVQLHGHLGPWVVAGARMGMAGAKAVDAKGHFDTVVICEGPLSKPPQACFIDGVQLGTGATLGKRTIHYVKSDDVVLKVKNPRTGKSVEVRPTKKLLDLLNPVVPKQDDPQADKKIAQNREMERIEQVSRDIAAMPDAELLTISH